MKKIPAAIRYFNRAEWMLWLGSVALIVISFVLFDRSSYTTMIASLVGVTSLIFIAKGNPIGQALIVVFSLFYGAISYSFRYYGEMLTYLLMTLPMAVVALVSWCRHPYQGKKSEVEVRRITRRDVAVMCALTAAVTVVFYFILKAFDTANLIVSTVSITTSFLAAYLMFLRSPYYALGYAANDVVLIVLWTLAALVDVRYVSVVVCFLAFLANDVYGYISWRAMQRRQSA